VKCVKCDELYYVAEDQSCKLCEMGDNCIHCNKVDNVCTACKIGFNPVEDKCEEIPAVCGDGLHGKTEQCDDGNTNIGDGCDVSCTVETNFKCVLEKN
jgi:cysteine-rich repeat protein